MRLPTSPPTSSSNLSTLLLTFILLLLPSLALCDVEFIRPTATDSFVAGEKFTISWILREPADVTAEEKGGSYSLELCAGSNAEITPLKFLARDVKLHYGETAVEASVDGNEGEDGRVYFLRLTINSPFYASTMTTFSPRFSLTSMAGTFPANIRTLNNKDLTPPPPQLPLQKRQGGVVIGAPPDAAGKSPVKAGDEFNVPYTLQTGPVRFAPMQKQPGTEITAKSARAQYPTSSVVIFTKAAKPATISTTNTAPITYPLTSVINMASSAPNPEDAMAKYLKRWADEEA